MTCLAVRTSASAGLSSLPTAPLDLTKNQFSSFLGAARVAFDVWHRSPPGPQEQGPAKPPEVSCCPWARDQGKDCRGGPGDPEDAFLLCLLTSTSAPKDQLFSVRERDSRFLGL